MSPNPTIHATRQDALDTTRSYVPTTNEDIEQIATYAFNHQVPVLHAAWALSIKNEGSPTLFCACAACERTGLTDRIEKVAHAAWSAEALKRNAAYRPVAEWLNAVNEAGHQAGLTEARSILAELELLAPPTEDLAV
jgi:hypothetical protein